MLLQVLHARQQQAGDEQHQPQPRSGIPQKIDGDGVRKEQQQSTGERRQEEKQPDGLPPHLPDGPPVAQGLVPGGEIGDARGQAHGGQGEQDGVDRQDELIQPHDLRPGQAGQPHPVGKAHGLGEDAGDSEKCYAGHERSPPGTPGLWRSSCVLVSVCGGGSGYAMQDFCQIPWNILLVCSKSFLNGQKFSPANLREKTIWPNRGKTPQKTVWFLGFFR